MTTLRALQRLVPAKLMPPQPLASWVPRERLTTRLGPDAAVPLTLVVAPAGFGKSTLVAQWLQGSQRAVAWLTLDEHDQDGLHVLTYLAGAIDRALPGAVNASAELLAAPIPLHVALQGLLVDLSRLERELTIVLDDYHLVAAESVHQAVAYLLRNLPPHCRLVIATRSDPPLPLARLRAERQLRELRAADLRFTVGETTALLAALNGSMPEEQLAVAVHQQTEGWAIALQLAALAAQTQPVREQGLALASRQIAEYLADEVLSRQDEAVYETLLTLAVVERFNAGLLAALLGMPDEVLAAESRLEQLSKANLFLVPLDAERSWYRFHQLFRDLLRRRLQLSHGTEAVRGLHRTAAGWFTAAGMLEDALRHVLDAGDEQAAAELVERLLPLEGTRSSSNGRMAYWLRMLPPDLVIRLPGLALIRAHLASVNIDLEGLAVALDLVERLLANEPARAAHPPWPSFAADLLAIRGVQQFWLGQPEAADTLRQALEQGMLPTLAGRCYLIRGLAMVNRGQFVEESAKLRVSLPGMISIPPAEQQAYRASCLVGMQLLAGEIDQMSRTTQTVMELLTQAGLSDTTLAYVSYCLGVAAYERDDLALAADLFRAATTRKYRVNHTTYVNAVVGMALVALAAGAYDEAAGYVQEAMLTAGEIGGSFLRHQALAAAARVALASGDLAAARVAAEQISSDIHLGTNLWLDAPPLTAATVLLSLRDPSCQERAATMLDQAVAQLQGLHNNRLLPRALVLRALLREGLGRPDQARVDLAQAELYAAPQRLVRCFLDLGPILLPRLRALVATSPAGYLAQLLAPDAPLAKAPQLAPTPRVAPLPELLTPRESDILLLLSQRWSDKEIAARLLIAPNTVRKHTGTIYQKLGVNDRREAVQAARALGLLQSEADVA